MSDLLTLAEACQRLGWGITEQAQDRLYARIIRAERRRKCQLLVRGGRGCRGRIAWRHVTEVTRTTSAVERISGAEWEDAMVTLDTRIAGIADRRANLLIDRRVMPNLRQVEGDVEKVAEAVNDLKERFVQLVDTPQTSDSSDDV